MTNLRTTLENAISDLDTAIERECLEDVSIIVAYMREALAKPDEPTRDIPTWRERCETHPEHQGSIVTSVKIERRMQEEIDDLRNALNRT